jgi:hypothetical protein
MGNSQIKKGNSESLGETEVFNKEQVEDEIKEQVDSEEVEDEIKEQVDSDEVEDEMKEQVDSEEVEDEIKEQVDSEEVEDEIKEPVEQFEVPLSSIPVNDKNGAFQLLIAFINLAYARGAYKQDEVEKIIECINKFVV